MQISGNVSLIRRHVCLLARGKFPDDAPGAVDVAHLPDTARRSPKTISAGEMSRPYLGYYEDQGGPRVPMTTILFRCIVISGPP